MAREDVNIKVSANVAEAIRLWKAMEEGPDGMARQLDSMAATGKRSASGMAQEFDKLVGKLTAVQLSITAAKRLLEEFQRLREEDVQRQGRAADSVDSASRRLAIQAGQSGSNSQLEALRNQVLDIAITRRVGPGQAFGAAEQLISSGFSANEVLQGGGLDEFLKILSATNQTGKQVDSRELAKQLSLYLTASGQDLNRGNLRSAGAAVYSLFKGTNLQVPAMGRYAEDAGTVTSLTGMGNEQLGVLAQFLGSYDEAKASTAFRSGVESLATAGAEQKKIDALARIGLTPGQVDFQGESFLEVQQRLTAAMMAQAPEIRNIISKQLFGSEGMPFATTLLNPAGLQQTREFMQLSREQDGFSQAVAISEGSLESRRAAAESREAKAFFDSKYIDPALMKQIIMTHLQEQGASRTTKVLTGMAYEFEYMLSKDPESAARVALDSDSVQVGPKKRTADALIERARAESVDVRVEIVDQNAIAIPHKSEVMQRGKQ